MENQGSQTRNQEKGKRKCAEKEDRLEDKKRKKLAFHPQIATQPQAEEDDGDGGGSIDTPNPTSALLDALADAVLETTPTMGSPIDQSSIYFGIDSALLALQSMGIPQPATGTGDMVVASDSSPSDQYTPHLPAPSSAVSEPSNDSDVALSHDPHEDRHTDLLATKWLKPPELLALVQREGLTYKKGKFSASEKKLLLNAMEVYKRLNDLSEEQLQAVIFSPDRGSKDKELWTTLAKAVPGRPVTAVYQHVRRERHPLKGKGAWGKWEDDLLRRAVAELGTVWKDVSVLVGREASDCRDRYRNHIVDRDIRATGPWSREEEEELTRIITDMTTSRACDVEGDVFWTEVSQLMGSKRGRQQCRNKWTDCLHKQVKNNGCNPRWSSRDASVLVSKVDALKVDDETDIDWKLLPDSNWNFWSAHVLQCRWQSLKSGIEGHGELSHQEIVRILRLKQSRITEVLSSDAYGAV